MVAKHAEENAELEAIYNAIEASERYIYIHVNLVLWSVGHVPCL